MLSLAELVPAILFKPVSDRGTLRDECLNSYVFGSVAEAQSLFDAWRRLQSGPTA